MPMSQAMETETQAEPRRIRRIPALFLGVIGVGYLYVGRIWLAVALIVAQQAVLLIAAWTRGVVEPIGWYTYALCLFVLLGVQVLHPVVLAWSRPVTPAKRYNRWWLYATWFVGATGVSMLVVPDPESGLGYGQYGIRSVAMSPVLQPGDRIIVDTWRFRAAQPAFGDIVVFRRDDEVSYIKRIVGLPGDTLEIRGRVLIRNGREVEEPYVGGPEPGSWPRGLTAEQLGPEEFFVLGDYRDNSEDSRHYGPIRAQQLVGRAEFIHFSASGGAVHWDRFPTMLTDD